MLYIPKIFHQIWIGGNPLPDNFLRYRLTWTSLHKGWELRVWDDDNIVGLKHFKALDFNSLQNFSEKSDYLRFCIILEFGGVYIDVDIECLKNIENIIQHEEFFIGSDPALYGKKETSNAAIFGSTPNHYLVQEIFGSFSHRIASTNKSMNSLEKLGPRYISTFIDKHAQMARVFPAYYFSPIHPKYFGCHTLHKKVDLSKSYAIHHYYGHWLPTSRKFGRYIYNLHPVIDGFYSYLKKLFF